MPLSPYSMGHSVFSFRFSPNAPCWLLTHTWSLWGSCSVATSLPQNLESHHDFSLGTQQLSVSSAVLVRAPGGNWFWHHLFPLANWTIVHREQWYSGKSRIYDLWRKTEKIVLLSLERRKANQGNCDSLKYLKRRLLRISNTEKNFYSLSILN